jgi:hypothetical protein
LLERLRPNLGNGLSALASKSASANELMADKYPSTTDEAEPPAKVEGDENRPESATAPNLLNELMSKPDVDCCDQ